MPEMDERVVIQQPLSAIAEAFEKLSKRVKERNNGNDIRLDTFCEAASLVSVLFRSLGLAFKFAELEYVAKVFSFFYRRILIISVSIILTSNLFSSNCD